MSLPDIFVAIYILIGMGIASIVWRDTLNKHGVNLAASPGGIIMIIVMMALWPFGHIVKRLLS